MDTPHTAVSFRQKFLPPSHYLQLFLALFVAWPTVTLAASVGQQPPFFELSGTDQKVYRLQDFKNKIVFVTFWASWCPPCREELPLLDKLQEQYDELVVLAINVDSEQENADQFIEEYNIKSLVLYDPQTRVVSSFGALAMPSSYIVDQNGIIRFSNYGFNLNKDPEKWKKQISTLLQN